MLVKDLIIKYHKQIPFPWTPAKIRKAGFDPTNLILRLGSELEQCEDAHSDAAKAVIEIVKELKLLT